jgi:hypothetical protein
MSFFEDASLVLIPSAIKDQKVYSVKPTDGTGDLTFSRASNATRVGPDGLIEKVRENLILQSNTFNTTWTTSSSTLTSGQAGYDGTNNAWEVNASSSGGGILQSNTQGGLQTFSVYAKGSVSTGIRLYAFGTVNAFAYFNLNTGALGSVSSGVIASIQSVGGGWYRCSISFNQTNTTLRFYTTDNNNANAAGIVYIQNSMLEAGDIATDYIATTTTAVSVGPVSGLPRLDYLGSTCPRLLLEPQRTNLLTYSEQLNDASWTKQNTTATANQTISPDGYVNADKLEDSATGSSTKLISKTANTSGVHTISGYFKKAEYNFVVVHAFGFAGAVFNLNTGVKVSEGGGTGAIVDAGNGWYKCSFTFTGVGNTNIYFSQSIDGSITYSGTAGSGIFAWGLQVEAGAYATSYIPTLSTSVTRVADAASKTGISSLIGQTEGTIFVEGEAVTIDTNASSPIYITVSDNNTTDICYFQQRSNGTIRVDYFTGAVLQARIASTTTYPLGTKIKAALGYKSGDFVFYINGVQIGTDVGTSIAPLSKVTIGGYETAGFTGSAISQALLFKTRLTNDQLAELTA